ncbi:mitochondrial inner membrane protease ATP23 homolog [Dendronephthya gigantea]|uniref:mitochondrial inner membrane protease ATP23 homolog n=1 Tax=Dendronephthya gigantea TaxID=151771 RepID=UPI00106A3A65|nr:mitochondrial inner membrane protease ATP23 homolog [Dendronephthya gigantea]
MSQLTENLEHTEAEKKSFPARVNGNIESNPRKHNKCLEWAGNSCRKAPYVKFMLDAMKKMGCNVDIGKHIVCEPCGENVLGGFDFRRKQVVLCENVIYSQSCMNDVLTHELIHAYDFARVKYEADNLRHLACTEIRAANLSGDCFFWKEFFSRFNFGWKSHQKECAKNRAVKSILCVSDVSREKAEDIVSSVFEECYKDTEPFDRIPP